MSEDPGFFSQLHVPLRLVIWLLVGMAFYPIARRILDNVLKRFAGRTRWAWDDTVVANGLGASLAHLGSAVLLTATRPLVGPLPVGWTVFIDRLLSLYLILAIYLMLVRLLRSTYLCYEQSTNTRQLPIKTLTQALTLVLTLFILILVVAQLTGNSPIHLLSGLGALTAILMLMFKDSILGFVAGIQLSLNDLVRKGDWIEMPSSGADGDVIDITLTTVQVQNWDKTITAIPAYDLVSKSFKNWRGMSRSGGRRIKRAIRIDMGSIRFLSADELAELSKIRILRPYLQQKQAEIEAWNMGHYQAEELANQVNGRRLTNIGTFRAYCSAFLQAHPEIHHDSPGLTFLIRQLEPDSQGLPLEIYVFAKDTRWVQYEAIQADLFDHLLAALPAFGLRAFQQPSGGDLRALRAERTQDSNGLAGDKSSRPSGS